MLPGTFKEDIMQETDSTQKQPNLEELNAICELPAVMVNQFYVTMFGNFFKITFCENDTNTGRIYSRASVCVPVEGLDKLLSTLQITVEEYQKTLNVQKSAMAKIHAINSQIEDEAA